MSHCSGFPPSSRPARSTRPMSVGRSSRRRRTVTRSACPSDSPSLPVRLRSISWVVWAASAPHRPAAAGSAVVDRRRRCSRPPPSPRLSCSSATMAPAVAAVAGPRAGRPRGARPGRAGRHADAAHRPDRLAATRTAGHPGRRPHRAGQRLRRRGPGHRDGHDGVCVHPAGTERPSDPPDRLS